MTNADAEGNSSEMSYTSSLQYLNSQLVAHGFAHSPGISLDGLSTPNMESVVKVLLSLMNQRVVRFLCSSAFGGLTNGDCGDCFSVFCLFVWFWISLDAATVLCRGIWRGSMS